MPVVSMMNLSSLAEASGFRFTTIAPSESVGQVGDDELGAGGQVDPHPVAFLHAECPQGVRHPEHLLPELPEGELGAVEVRGGPVREGPRGELEEGLGRYPRVADGGGNVVVIVPVPGFVSMEVLLVVSIHAARGKSRDELFFNRLMGCYFFGCRGSVTPSVGRPKEAVSSPLRGWFFAYIPLSFRARTSG